MAIVPKIYLNIFFFSAFWGTSHSLYAQSKLSESIFEQLNHQNKKDSLTPTAKPSLGSSLLASEKNTTNDLEENQKASVDSKKSSQNVVQSNEQNVVVVNVKKPNFEIPSAFISLGNHQPTYGIVVEKEFHKLTVYKLQEDGNYIPVKSYRAITGKEKGDKKYSGDNRTPEGIYFVVGRKAPAELYQRWGNQAKKYGPMAFVLDYPNIFDRRSHKTGYGIWIHGVDRDSRILNPFDTEGCVALTNKDVIDISQYISAFETPVVIVGKMQSSSLDFIQDERDKVLNMLETWRRSWESSDINTYSAFYSNNFYSLGRTKQQWESFKKSLAKRRDSSIQVQISEPKVLSFKNQLLVEFFQKYTSKEKQDFGRKFLYLHQEGDNFKIIAEKWYPIKNQKELELAVLNNKRQAKKIDINSQPKISQN